MKSIIKKVSNGFLVETFDENYNNIEIVALILDEALELVKNFLN